MTQADYEQIQRCLSHTVEDPCCCFPGETPRNPPSSCMTIVGTHRIPTVPKDQTGYDAPPPSYPGNVTQDTYAPGWTSDPTVSQRGTGVPVHYVAPQDSTVTNSQGYTLFPSHAQYFSQ